MKTTVVNIDHTAVSTVSETLHESELYAKHRSDMRKDEENLRKLCYQIEDEILAELDTAGKAETA